ncbi:hypothetical protein [Listeria booriae]|uniref:hypothetical protein n=1 Tax=Listeria booriae TaxID=1552123 RepID=UPI001628C500|nr:hypothetical protein [Listeria booriae]MBC2104051.1 hypothetical protein [Listeria booriae]
MNTLMIIGAIVAGLILLIITAGVVTYIIHKKHFAICKERRQHYLKTTFSRRTEQNGKNEGYVR